jgi:catechol 2,3-dioxygenase-like lactoylglutathione lyase family enzyme
MEIKALLKVGLVGTLLLGCQQQTQTKAQEKTVEVKAPEANSQEFPTDFRRLSLIVDDIDESLKLYRDVLEFSVNYDTEVTMSGKALPAGEPGAKARLVLLSSNDSWVGWLGMLQWLDPKLPPREDKYARMGIGEPVLVFNTEKVDEHCEAVAKLPGVKMTAEAGNTTYPARAGGKPITVRTCYLFDRDGYFMELNKVLDRTSYNEN